MALLNFNANTVEPNDNDFDILPAGEYKVEITDSEMKPTKAGTGERLSLTMKVLEGPFSGRLLWEGLNLVNPNPKAVEIAQRTLSAICHATGRINITDSSQLHGVPMLAKVIVKNDPQYGDKNEIKSYKNAGVATPGMGNGQVMPAQSGPSVGAPPTAGAPSEPGWSRPQQGAA